MIEVKDGHHIFPGDVIMAEKKGSVNIITLDSGKKMQVNDEVFEAVTEYEDTPELQNKTVTPSTSQQTVIADDGYQGLDTVTVEAVTSSIDANIVAGNIKKDVSILGVTGTLEIEPNIVFSTTAPTDTSKLWVNTNKTINKFSFVSNEPSTISQYISLNDRADSAAGYTSCVYTGTYVYLFGNPNNTSIMRFNPIAKTFTTISATLPNAVSNMNTAKINDKIYLFGNSDTIMVFDISTETISTLQTTLPTASYGFGVGVKDDKIYLIGGRYTDTIMVFDTTNESISILSTLSSNFYYMGSAQVGNKVYLFGGYEANVGSLNTIKVFDIDTETLTTLSTTIPTTTYGIDCEAYDGKICLIGGYNSSTANVFDTETETITTNAFTFSLGNNSKFDTSVIINNVIYVFNCGQGGVAYYEITINDLEKQDECCFRIGTGYSNSYSQNNQKLELLPSYDIYIYQVYLGNNDGTWTNVTNSTYYYNGEQWTVINT